MNAKNTKSPIFNFLTGGISEVLIIFLNLIVRKVLISSMGVEYLGINGVFNSLLSLLSLTELGIGTSIIYHMYKPIVEKDNEKIKQLLVFFRKTYHIIGAVVVVVGVILSFFLSVVVNLNEIPITINASLLFLLYLAQSASTYFFFGYKNALLKANQNLYIINAVTIAISITNMIGQIVVLVIFHNIYLYVAIIIAGSLIQNGILSIICDRKYPFIKEKTHEKLSAQERKELLKNCYALSIYRINGVIVYSTDSIIISKFIGLATAGVFSNYQLIVTYLKQFTKLMFKSVADTIGLIHADKNIPVEGKYQMFKTFNLITAIVSSVSSVGVFVVSDLFISAFFGTAFVLDSKIISALLGVDVYLQGIQQCVNTYRNSMGLFQQAKYRPILSAVFNLVISIILVTKLGITGVLVGTIVSNILTTSWIDPVIVYKHGFMKPAREYFVTNIFYLLVTVAAAAVTASISWSLISNNIISSGIVKILAAVLASCVIPLLFFLIIFYRTNEFRQIQLMLKTSIKNMKELRNANKR